jgi:hypothetical protein
MSKSKNIIPPDPTLSELGLLRPRRGRPAKGENREQQISKSVDTAASAMEADIRTWELIQTMFEDLHIRDLMVERRVIHMIGKTRAKLAALPYTKRSMLMLNEHLGRKRTLESIVEDHRPPSPGKYRRKS